MKKRKKAKGKKPRRAKRRGTRGDRGDGARVRAALDRWIRYRRPEDRAAAIEAIMPRVRLSAAIYAKQRGLYGAYAEDVLSSANEAAVHIVDQWKRRNKVSQLHVMIVRRIIDAFRLERGRPHVGRARVRAAEIPFIRARDLAEGPGGARGAGSMRSAKGQGGGGVLVDGFLDARVVSDDIRIDGIEEATQGLRRVKSAKHRAVLTLLAAGWSQGEIGEAFGITESAVSWLTRKGRGMAQRAERRAQFAARLKRAGGSGTAEEGDRGASGKSGEGLYCGARRGV